MESFRIVSKMIHFLHNATLLLLDAWKQFYIKIDCVSIATVEGATLTK